MAKHAVARGNYKTGGKTVGLRLLKPTQGACRSPSPSRPSRRSHPAPAGLALSPQVRAALS
eukprot:10445907-Alexandrium_andersonii.AAC.1